MRVLLIESEPEDVLFLRDVLMEIGEGRYWDPWVSIEILDAASWCEAAAILSNEPVDVALLNPDLPDSQGIETFRRAQNAAPSIPIVVLVGASEESLGLRMVRDGAQDFLVKKHVDCAPLAHAMKNAIERQRILTALSASATRDTLTGLLNRSGFLASAEHDRRLAERLGRRLLLTVAEPKDLAEIANAYGEQRRDLALVEAADHLRGFAGSTDLLGRIGCTRFAMSTFETAEPLEDACERRRTGLVSHRIQIGAAIFSADHPATLDSLLQQAAVDLAPNALSTRA
jgi:PleD family two-component response regulator